MEIWAIKNNKENPMEMLNSENFDRRIDSDVLIGKIVEVCGAMTPIHNTSESHKYFHELFFKMWKPQISRMLDTMELDYIPLENFSRFEDLKHDANEINENVESLGTVSESNGSSSGTSENKTSAYNENVYQPNDENVSSGTTKNNYTENSNKNVNKNRTFGSTDDNKIHGNNGLFSSQQLLEQERKVAEYNVYQWIVQKYMEQLFLCVF